MRTVILVVVATAVLSAALVFGQEPLAPPTCKPDLKMVVETLADYNLEHQSVIYAGSYWGLTDVQKRKIYVSDEPDYTIRKLTVLHEMVHVCYHTKAVGLPKEVEEAMADAIAKQLYVELFGN